MPANLFSFKNIISQLLPCSPRINDDDYRKGQLLISTVLITFFLNILSLPVYLIDRFYIGFFCTLVDIVVLLFLYFFYKKSQKYRFSNHFLAIRGNVYVLALVLTSGGLYSPFVGWLVAVPLATFLLSKPKHGYFWLVVVSIECIVFFVIGMFYQYLLPIYNLPAITFMGVFGLLLYLWSIILVYEQSRFLAMRYIETNKQKIKAQKENILFHKNILERKQKEIILQNEFLESQTEIIQSINYRLANTALDKSQKLAQTYQELDLFLYRSSHDLRRPITAILGLLELIKLENEENQALGNVSLFLDKVLITAVNMDKMLRKLIMISEVNHENSTPTEINFDKVIAKILNFAEDKFPDALVELDYKIKNEEKNIFYQNNILIEIALLNILENAIIFQNPRADEPIIDFHFDILKKETIITIQDNGIGINEEYLDKVFNLFFKASNQSEGNGLGLYITKKAIEKMKGDIKIESKPKIGTKFIIHIPNIPQNQA